MRLRIEVGHVVQRAGLHRDDAALGHRVVVTVKWRSANSAEMAQHRSTAAASALVEEHFAFGDHLIAREYGEYRNALPACFWQSRQWHTETRSGFAGAE